MIKSTVWPNKMSLGGFGLKSDSDFISCLPFYHRAKNGLRKSVLGQTFTCFGQKVEGVPLCGFFAEKTTCGIVKHPLTMQLRGGNLQHGN